MPNPKRLPLRHWLVARLLPEKQRALYLQSIYGGYGWPTSSGAWITGVVREPYAGAWQRNIEATTSTMLSFSPVYACVTGISQDIGKMRVKLSRNIDGIWEEITENQPWLPLLRTPNHYQDHVKFFESWMISKLLSGNTYVYKHRDNRGVVNALYVLHPGCVRPLVADNGEVFYEIQRDDLSGLNEPALEVLKNRYDRLAIPASEIIHDRMNCLWHPLIGVSPLYACGNSATLGSAIQNSATLFFQNRGMPGGHLTAPDAISDETAARLKALFDSGFTGQNVGKLLVTGDGLKFEPFEFEALKNQQKEQFDGAVVDVARAFRYPLWKLNGSDPPYEKPDQAQTLYYTDCLGVHIVAIEECLDHGLELPLNVHCEFDLDELMRMDQTALYESLNTAGKFMKLNEQRFRANMDALPVGGDTVYKQEQDHSIEYINAVDKLGPPNPNPAPPAAPPPEEPEPNRQSLSPEVIAVLAEYRARSTAA